MEPTLRSAQVLKQEAEDIGLQGKDIAEYVTRQQNLDREERAALVDLIVKEQFINACSEDLAMYLLERGPKDLVELTTWAQLIDVPLANVYLDSPYYKGHCRVMMITRVVIYLLGCLGGPTRRLRRVLRRRETLRRNHPSPRKMMTMLDGM